jgi:hypothetical protein
MSSTEKSSTLLEVAGLLVTLISVILAQFQKQQTRFWALMGVGALTVLVGLYRPLISGVRTLLRKTHNAIVVRRNSHELRRLSREAGVFFDTSISRNDTLQGILNDVSQRRTNIVLASRIPNAGIFQGHWHYLDSRIRGDSLSVTVFHNAADELLSLLRSYTSFSVLPVFYSFAAEFREVLTDAERSKMNAFQQQYVGFQDRYANFLMRLNDEFHGMPEFQAAMAKPTPL